MHQARTRRAALLHPLGGESLHDDEVLPAAVVTELLVSALLRMSSAGPGSGCPTRSQRAGERWFTWSCCLPMSVGIRAGTHSVGHRRRSALGAASALEGGRAMPYIPTISPEEAAGPVKELYDRELAGQGYVSNYTRAFSRRPEVLAGWQALKDAITSGMEPRLYELATVAAATAIRSSYCSLVHGQILATSYYQ